MKELRMQTFDGTQRHVSPGEREQVQRRLVTGVEGLLARHPDFVDVHNGSSIELAFFHSSGRNYRISGIREDVLGAPSIYKLSVSEGFGSLLHWYEPDEVGVVRRNDIHIGSMGRMMAASIVTTDDGRIDMEGTEVLMDLTQAEEAPNSDLARSTYFNLQPVGVDEVNSIFEAAEDGQIPTVSLQNIMLNLRDRINYPGGEDLEQATEAAVMFEEDIDRYFARGGKARGGVSANPALDEQGFTYHVGRRSGREAPFVEIAMARVDGELLRGVTVRFTNVNGLFIGSRTLTEARIPEASGAALILSDEPDVASASLYVYHQRQLRNFLNEPTFNN